MFDLKFSFYPNNQSSLQSSSLPLLLSKLIVVEEASSSIIFWFSFGISPLPTKSYNSVFSDKPFLNFRILSISRVVRIFVPELSVLGFPGQIFSLTKPPPKILNPSKILSQTKNSRTLPGQKFSLERKKLNLLQENSMFFSSVRTIPGQISPGHSQDGQLQDKKTRRPNFNWCFKHFLKRWRFWQIVNMIIIFLEVNLAYLEKFRKSQNWRLVRDSQLLYCPEICVN